MFACARIALDGLDNILSLSDCAVSFADSALRIRPSVDSILAPSKSNPCVFLANMVSPVVAVSFLPPDLSVFFATTSFLSYVGFCPMRGELLLLIRTLIASFHK